MSSNSQPPETSHRLFFALWPDDATRARLAAQVAAMPLRHGRRVRAGNLHLTLAFIGNADADYRQCLSRAAEAVSAPTFDCVVSETGSFPRARVVWFGLAAVPDALAGLAERLNAALASDCGYQPERRPFRPHMTVVRKVMRGPRDWRPEPVPWRVEDFCLVESRSEPDGVRYGVVRRYPLQAG